MALDWTTETLRLSLFCSENVKLTIANWTTITGQDEPQTVQNVAPRRSFVGPFHDGTLNISAVGPRVDCVLLPKSPTEAIEEGYVPTIGSWPSACDAFVKATSEWLARFEQPVHRIAFGGSLIAKCESITDAYRQLLSMLQSVKGDPNRMRELIYRVSWPLQSKAVDGLLLNRITSWATLQIQLQLMVQTGAKTTMTETAATHVVRLEIDHSTDADRTNPFDRSQLVPIYRELVSLAAENAEKGEVL